jgi:SAM-dependent methyltransferase
MTVWSKPLKSLIARLPPNHGIALQKRLKRMYRPAWLGTLRNTRPLSDCWGYDRGMPVDRYYIEAFLQQHRQDIRSHVLEVHDKRYTERFGVGVELSDILDIDSSNVRATVVADLSKPNQIQSEAFDCFILTQTLHLIYDVRDAIIQAHRILRPGGVLLVTVPSVSRINPEYGLKCDHWRFTVASCQKLFAEIFGATVEVSSYGNVLACIAFLAGLASQELSFRELEAHDDHFPLIIAVRAVKTASPSKPSRLP